MCSLHLPHNAKQHSRLWLLLPLLLLVLLLLLMRLLLQLLCSVETDNVECIKMLCVVRAFVNTHTFASDRPLSTSQNQSVCIKLY